jgi:hypothetical protein
MDASACVERELSMRSDEIAKTDDLRLHRRIAELTRQRDEVSHAKRTFVTTT